MFSSDLPSSGALHLPQNNRPPIVGAPKSGDSVQIAPPILQASLQAGSLAQPKVAQTAVQQEAIPPEKLKQLSERMNKLEFSKSNDLENIGVKAWLGLIAGEIQRLGFF